MAEQVRSLRHDLPVIICSGYIGDLTREQIAAICITGYCPKTIERPRLLESIQPVAGTDKPV